MKRYNVKRAKHNHRIKSAPPSFRFNPLTL
jgi:hypothetical protein